MICKWSLLGVSRFYTREEALTLLMNMSYFEDESTSESENEGDSSDSSEYAPEQQYQVRTDSNIQTVLPKETVNQNTTKHALLAEETATTSGEEHVASPPKVSKAKEIPKRGQKAAPKLAVNQSATKAMASNSDMDVEDYYIVEDANKSASSQYVPCVNYPNDKVYPEDEKNGWVRLGQDTGPPNIYRFEVFCQNYLNLNNYTPGAVFDEFLESKMWTILSKNTKKYQKLEIALEKIIIYLIHNKQFEKCCGK